MAMPETKTSDEGAEIIVNEQGVPVIAGADFKVRHIATDYIETGNSVAGIQRQHPLLSKAQIQVAISYYLDNKRSFDADDNRARAHMKGYTVNRPTHPYARSSVSGEQNVEPSSIHGSSRKGCHNRGPSHSRC